MTTAYTSLLGLALPVDGELTGTWGQTVNNYITTYLDGAVAGTQIISGTQTAVTLSKTTGTSLSQAGTGATGSSQYQIIRCTGNPASLLTITVPAADKTYVVINATSTSQSVKIVGAGPTTGVTITSGSQAIVAWNGSDFVNLTPAVSGYLPTTGGTMTGAITFAAGQFGTNVNTFLTTPTSANLAAALTDETGSGAAVFATSPTLVTPVLGTPSSGTLSSCTVDGTNGVGYKNIPLSGIKTASYTLVAGDVGKFIELGTSGSVVVPASVFAAGDAISIFNNTSASISCTCSAVTTVYKGGTDADISSFSVTTRGVATILFITATVAVITGNLA